MSLFLLWYISGIVCQSVTITKGKKEITIDDAVAIAITALAGPILYLIDHHDEINETVSPDKKDKKEDTSQKQ